MIIRTPAFIAMLSVLGLAAGNRVSAQPVAPNRPPASAFGSFFYPGAAAVPNGYGGGYGGFNGINGFNNINGIQRQGIGANYYGPGGIIGNNYGQGGAGGLFAPYILNSQPVVFNSRSHWFSNYYGHWYPNGLTNGTGALSNGGNGGGLRLTGVSPTLGMLGAPSGSSSIALPGGGGAMPAAGAAGAGPAIR